MDNIQIAIFQFSLNDFMVSFNNMFQSSNKITPKLIAGMHLDAFPATEPGLQPSGSGDVTRVITKLLARPVPLQQAAPGEATGSESGHVCRAPIGRGTRRPQPAPPRPSGLRTARAVVPAKPRTG
jgi:hypothetical protein